MKKFLAVGMFLLPGISFAQGRTVATELTPASGPPASVAQMLAGRHGFRPQVVIQGASFDGFLVPAAINSPGRNGTFFKTDFFITNNRGISQEILIAWIPQGVSANGLGASRFTLSPNTVYLLSDFLAGGSGRLSESGVGALLVTGVFAGTNTLDPNALLEGSDRIWTFEAGSSGTNSFTLDSQFGDVFGTAVATSSGLKQDAGFRTNVGIVNLDSNFAHTWNVRVAGSGQVTNFAVTVPPLSMQLIAVPGGFAPGNFFVEFTPDAGMAGEVWSAYAVTADNITGDSWVARAVQP